MNQPLVSIILPVYNAQSHLARCIESICAQTYRNLEIIILNDGSKDNSLPVCEEYRQKDPRILLVDKANSGVSDPEPWSASGRRRIHPVCGQRRLH